MTRIIRHTFHFRATRDEIIAALTTVEGLRKWWTVEAEADGDTIHAAWSGFGWQVDIVIDPARPPVSWTCTRSNMQDTDAWLGSTMRFDLIPDGHGTRMEFEHGGYRDSPCFDACFAGWHFFLGDSLKACLETGTGKPYDPRTWPKAA